MSDDLLHDDRITLWGLRLEVHAGIGRPLERVLRAETGLSDAWFDVLLRIGRTPGQAVGMTDLANQVDNDGKSRPSAENRDIAGRNRRPSAADSARGYGSAPAIAPPAE